MGYPSKNNQGNHHGLFNMEASNDFASQNKMFAIFHLSSAPFWKDIEIQKTHLRTFCADTLHTSTKHLHVHAHFCYFLGNFTTQTMLKQVAISPNIAGYLRKVGKGISRHLETPRAGKREQSCWVFSGVLVACLPDEEFSALDFLKINFSLCR